ncbi:class I SAM-dependent methyltransferase [Paenibacillus nanensis]|uniref:Class I SAM-dependent methyltransferase n=1 Tax=Paenibacillus nanensis TaxID=393251 RepID=A0A3A1UX02_9BACL|nr:class I SAM-dependent methyltransferase [Paenibacillus nanensis]RIX50853.1 class I SAM-dependent methyltransferase [Paenibacillus nanensis]
MEEVKDFYRAFDEEGRLDREPLEFQVNLHYIRKFLPPNGRVADIGAGPGRYALELARIGYQLDVADIMPRFLTQARERAESERLAARFSGFYEADARDLSCFSDECFDASLMLGPFYHLQHRKEREQAARELRRITKQGGVVFAAFMPRIRHLIQSLQQPEHWKPNHRIEGLRRFLDTGIFNHSDPGRFTGAYFERIEDIVPFMEDQGFRTIELVGSDGFAQALHENSIRYWREQGESTWDEMMEVICEGARSPYLLGAAAHILYIGRRS